MKKLYFLASVGLLTACLAGCNRGWSGCFSRGLTYTPESYENCDPCCESEGYESYYVEPGGEWVPTTVESIPTPGPAPAEEAKN